jgi:glutathione peroxidase
MNRFIAAALIIPALAAAQETAMPSSVYDFTVKNIDGADAPLSAYKGKVLLIVNVASKCGFTPQYEGLEALYKKYADKGLVVLGFPANNFMWQEPGSDADIKQFCSLKYNVTFPMFSKISVKGKEKAPLYKFLTEKETDPAFAGEISWNFNKFVIGRDGVPVARFGSRETPEGKAVVEAVEKALAQ